MSSNYEAYKQQLVSYGVDESTADLAAQGCVSLDEGRDRNEEEQAATDTAYQTITEATHTAVNSSISTTN